MLFASAGYQVVLYDVVSANVDTALADIKFQLQNLQEKGLLRGKLSADEQFALISKADTLSDCLKDAIHIQVSNLQHSLQLPTVYLGNVRRFTA